MTNARLPRLACWVKQSLWLRDRSGWTTKRSVWSCGSVGQSTALSRRRSRVQVPSGSRIEARAAPARSTPLGVKPVRSTARFARGAYDGPNESRWGTYHNGESVLPCWAWTGVHSTGEASGGRSMGGQPWFCLPMAAIFGRSQREVWALASVDAP